MFQYVFCETRYLCSAFSLRYVIQLKNLGLCIVIEWLIAPQIKKKFLTATNLTWQKTTQQVT